MNFVPNANGCEARVYDRQLENGEVVTQIEVKLHQTPGCSSVETVSERFDYEKHGAAYAASYQAYLTEKGEQPAAEEPVVEEVELQSPSSDEPVLENVVADEPFAPVSPEEPLVPAEEPVVQSEEQPQGD